MTWLSGESATRIVSLSWWSNERWTPGTYGRLVVMSRSVSCTLPSCMSLGWTNRMSSRIPSSLRSAAHTRPSKSERVTSRYRSATCVVMRRVPVPLPKSYGRLPDVRHRCGIPECALSAVGVLLEVVDVDRAQRVGEVAVVVAEGVGDLARPVDDVEVGLGLLAHRRLGGRDQLH